MRANGEGMRTALYVAERPLAAIERCECPLGRLVTQLPVLVQAHHDGLSDELFQTHPCIVGSGAAP